MPARAVLFEPNEAPKYVHFMTSGMASLVALMVDGIEVEVGVTGREGLAESLYLLGPERTSVRCFMQVPGTALRMDFKQFQEEVRTHSALNALVLKHAQYAALLLTQLAACNAVHEIEERLARWLLMVQDRVEASEFPLTQEFLANMLATRRTSVSLTTGALRRAGLVDNRRGVIRIVDRQGLEEVACECYAGTKRLLHDLTTSR